MQSSRARKDAKKLPKKMKEKIVELLDYLERNPVPIEKYDIKKLKGLHNTYRIRLGNWRLIYNVDFKEKLIMILKIDTPEKVYK